MICHRKPLNLNLNIFFIGKEALYILDCTFYCAFRCPFFFLRLPIGQYGPVSQLSRSEESCTGPFNWGEAHCAGEKVKRKIGPFLRKSLKNQTRTRTQQKGRSPPRQPGTPRPGSGARAKEENNHNKQETSQTNLGTP